MVGGGGHQDANAVTGPRAVQEASAPEEGSFLQCAGCYCDKYTVVATLMSHGMEPVTA